MAKSLSAYTTCCGIFWLTIKRHFAIHWPPESKFLFVLFVLNVLLLIAGCFMDAISAFYIFIPLFLPLCKTIGIDPVHLGIIMTGNLAIGMITPPVGVDLYTACAISGVPFKDLARKIWPFVIASFVPLVLITYIPGISLWLPKILGMR